MAVLLGSLVKYLNGRCNARVLLRSPEFPLSLPFWLLFDSVWFLSSPVISADRYRRIFFLFYTRHSDNEALGFLTGRKRLREGVGHCCIEPIELFFTSSIWQSKREEREAEMLINKRGSGWLMCKWPGVWQQPIRASPFPPNSNTSTSIFAYRTWISIEARFTATHALGYSDGPVSVKCLRASSGGGSAPNAAVTTVRRKKTSTTTFLFFSFLPVVFLGYLFMWLFSLSVLRSVTHRRAALFRCICWAKFFRYKTSVLE